MKSFKHRIPAMRIYQGEDSMEQLSQELDRLKIRRAVIMCGATLGRGGPPLDLVRGAVGERLAGVYAGVRPHSPVPAVQEAAGELERMGADAVISFGGGSAMVTARAADILRAEKDDPRNLCTRPGGNGKHISPRLMAPKLPQFVIPTTPTTAAVKAGSAVLDPDVGERLPLFDPQTRARAIFIHPDLIATPSRELFVSAGVNTLALAIEGLLSRSGDPLSDAHLMHAVRLLAQRLSDLVAHDELPVRADLVMASVLAGHGSDYTGAGIAIPLGHAIGAKHHIDMGITDAIVMPPVLRFNADAASAGIGKLFAALGLVPAAGVAPVTAVVETLNALFRQLGIPARLRDVGVSRESLRELAEVSINDWYMANNPRPVKDVQDLVGLLEEAW
ncbi:MAG: iron-containing alcohol dehydrogenase family protein [Pseudomonadota bacterium]